MNQNNKFIGYLQYGTKQQPQPHRQQQPPRRAGSHLTADSTVLQDSPSWVYKGEWNGTLGQNMFAEFRAGQFGYNFGLDSNTNATRYESLTTNEILGGGRGWELRRRRNQYTGALSYFKDNFARRLAQLQVRRRVPRREGRDISGRRPTPTMSCTSSTAPPGPLSATTPGAVRSATTSTAGARWRRRASSSPTPGRSSGSRSTSALRFDRYRVWLPAQSLPAGRFVPVASRLRRGPERGHLQPPRAAHRRDLRPHRRRQDGAQGATGAASTSIRVSPSPTRSTRTPADQYADYVLERPQRRSRLPGRRSRRAADHASAAWPTPSIDPEPEELLHRRDVGLRRARGACSDLGVRVGLRLQEGQRRLAAVQRRCGRSSAFNVPVTIIDPGPDGVVGNGDDGPASALFNLDDTTPRLAAS